MMRPQSFRVQITYDWVTQMLGMTAMIIFSEYLVDWIKHCFVTKFNHLKPELYSKYQAIICSDIVIARAKAVCSGVRPTHVTLVLTRFFPTGRVRSPLLLVKANRLRIDAVGLSCAFGLVDELCSTSYLMMPARRIR